MSNTSTLTDLTRDVADFLGLPADLDLPQFASATISRQAAAPAWDVKAQLRTGSDEETWAALTAWAAILGGSPSRGRVWSSPQRPSGYCWEGLVVVSVAETTIEVWGPLDAEFELPLPGPVRVTGLLAIGDRVRTPSGRYGVVTHLGCDDADCVADVRVRLDENTASLCWESRALTVVERAHVTGLFADMLIGGDLA
jgi:hypothetical protein